MQLPAAPLSLPRAKRAKHFNYEVVRLLREGGAETDPRAKIKAPDREAAHAALVGMFPGAGVRYCNWYRYFTVMFDMRVGGAK